MEASLRVYCKVCAAPVPPRKTYQPRACEACKKFFTRISQQLQEGIELHCSNDSKCIVSDERGRNCRKCRFEKSLAAGMTSKFLGMKYGNTSDSPDDDAAQDISPTHATAVTDCSGKDFDNTNGEPNKANYTRVDQRRVQHNSVAIIRSPVSYEGSVIESTLKMTAISFTHLHAIEFMDLKRVNEPITDISQFVRLGKNSLEQAVYLGLSYGRNFLGREGFEGLSDNDLAVQITDLNKLISPIGSMIAVFSNLPGNAGASFGGIDDSFMPILFSWFPEFQVSCMAYKNLADALDEWRPSLIEVSALVALLFFHGGDRIPIRETRKRIESCHRRLLLACNLLVSKAYPNDLVEQELARQRFLKCFHLARTAGQEARRLLIAVESRNPAYLAESRQFLNSIQ